MAAVPSLEELRALALGAGLQHLGCTDAEPFTVVRQILEERRDAGLNGTMQFTYRNPERSTDPERTLPGARTLIAGATSYHRDPPARPVDDGPVARVARYVWADDRERLLAGLQAMCDALTGAGHRACVVSDQNHLVDRPVAERAGLGWFGKNANLLLPGHGSWYLLGTVLTDAALPDAPRAEPVADGCGTCERCRPACPTGAIVEPGTVDARLCLSWTLQMTGSFPRDQRVALGDRHLRVRRVPGGVPAQPLGGAPGGTGGRSGRPPGPRRPDRAWVSVLDLLVLPMTTNSSAHGRWYVPSEIPATSVRNLAALGRCWATCRT
jgi:epoxyqueuosine reductase